MSVYICSMVLDDITHTYILQVSCSVRDGDTFLNTAILVSHSIRGGDEISDYMTIVLITIKSGFVVIGIKIL